MFSFTFNTLERVGILDRVYVFLANLANRYVLSRHNFDTEYIADVFNALDGFWLKYGRMEKYNESQIRVIVGSVVESLRDNQLNADEVRKLTRYVTSKWNPEVAETKTSKPLDVLLPPHIEDVAKRSADLYGQFPPSRVRPEDFVALGTEIIAKNLDKDDKGLIGSMINALKAR